MTRSRLAAAFLVLVAGAVSTPAEAKGKKPKKPAATAEAPKAEATDFDRQAASSAIGAVDLQKCKATNAAKGEGHVTITFEPAGNVANALIDKGPWLGTPVAKCMAGQFKKAKVPAFKGSSVTVGKSFRFD